MEIYLVDGYPYICITQNYSSWDNTLLHNFVYHFIIFNFCDRPNLIDKQNMNYFFCYKTSFK